MTQLQTIEAIEKRLWGAADTLRANSNYASNEYFMPVMGLIFLRHAYSRYLAVKDGIIAGLPSRGGKTRPLTKEDFSQKGAIFLRHEAEFDTLVSLPDSADRAAALIAAMDSIEQDYESLRGVLPKAEYQELDNAVLGQLLRTLNPEELKTASGDIFGRIYEYFLTQFADQKAHDGGEFFTPVSLVQMIVNLIEPDHGKVLDPACGSGGMFVQSANLVERRRKKARETLTFYGLEKNATTIRLARMNLAVHGLEGNIQKAISYYDDPHELLGKSDFVMANPPFNVDEVDADKIKNDPRLPFGLPGVNNKGKVSNGNYLWISYFYSYLNAQGRAGFVMSSQASSAGRDEATVRRKLVETGHVDAMVAIRSNFFYTRTVPCELWFLDKGKPAKQRDKVLMLDARNVYRKVTRKIYDFSPEQLANLTSIVWLYRGQTERFLELLTQHTDRAVLAAQDCFSIEYAEPLPAFARALQQWIELLRPPVKGNEVAHPDFDLAEELQAHRAEDFASHFKIASNDALRFWNKFEHSAMADLSSFLNDTLKPLAEQSADLIKQVDHLFKLASRMQDTWESAPDFKETAKLTGMAGLRKLRSACDDARKNVVEHLKTVRYLYRQAHWLQDRFPDAQLRDVPGLVKLVTHGELEANDWSLTPGRYVGVAPEEVDEDFDFEAALKDVHIELQGLNAEAAELAAKIARNFEELGA
ncbi:MAG: N-6 DNA methylase [Gammaproteobacteria bacterium]|nr:N-6 DNA methylase [Gammaproteobacteria bacterium]